MVSRRDRRPRGGARLQPERRAASRARLGDAEIIANAEINLSLNHLALGEAARAQAGLEAIAAAPPPEFPFMRWRYSMHLEDALGRVALARGEPGDGAARTPSARSKPRAATPRAKLEARALALRAQALAALERRDEALAATGELLAIAERIGYARASWQGLALAAELERRAGRGASARGAARRSACRWWRRSRARCPTPSCAAACSRPRDAAALTFDEGEPKSTTNPPADGSCAAAAIAASTAARERSSVSSWKASVGRNPGAARQGGSFSRTGQTPNSCTPVRPSGSPSHRCAMRSA